MAPRRAKLHARSCHFNNILSLEKFFNSKYFFTVTITTTKFLLVNSSNEHLQKKFPPLMSSF